MKIYNKLVRDNIPAIIKKTGRIWKFSIANEKEYEQKILEKLSEEVQEFLSDKNKEELADMLEVIDGICELYWWKMKDIKNIQEKKKLEKWWFTKKLILESVS